MNGEQEKNNCSICGKEKIVSRRYYHYEIECDCCVGDKHFEIIWFCKECKPSPPNKIKIVLENQKPID